jgi:uncharacterized repeat protein (TIGR01451 family)
MKSSLIFTANYLKAVGKASFNMKQLINKSKVSKVAGLALAMAISVSFIAMGRADNTFQLSVHVTDACGPIVAQVTVVNGPDDGAFGITDASGNFTFASLNAGVFYLHVAADGHNSQDTGTIVLNSDQSVSVNLDSISGCAPTPTPTPTPNPTPNPNPPATASLAVHVGDVCGPVPSAQVTVVNGPDDGAFGLTDGSGNFTFGSLNTGVFYLHIAANGENSQDTGTIVLTSDQSVSINLDRTSPCPGSNPPPPVPTPTPTPTPTPVPPPPPVIVSISFHVHANCIGENIPNALVSINGGPSGTTNSSGNVSLSVVQNSNISWTASASGYNSASGSINAGNGNNIDVTLTRTCASPTPPPPPVRTPTPTPTPTPVPPPPPVTITNNNNSNNTTNTNVNNNTNITQNGNGNCANVNNNGANNSNTTQTNTCNTTVVTTTVTPPPPPPVVIPQNATLNLTKQVRDLTTGTNFANFMNASQSDTLQFQLVVTNNSNVTANNVRLSDSLPFGLSYVMGSFSADNGVSFGNLFNGSQSLGSLGAGQSRTVTFQTTITTSGTMVNSATASADNSNTANAQASVFVASVAGSNINLVLSKSAFNQTQNVDATSVPAHSGDLIVYTLSVQNTGNAPATNFVFSDNLSDVLQLSQLQDFGGSAFNLANLTLTWPAVTIPANGTVQKTFSVMVDQSFPAGSDNLMTNTFGNTINVTVLKPTVFTAPKTGPTTDVVVMLSVLTVAGFAFYKHQTQILAFAKQLISTYNV